MFKILGFIVGAAIAAMLISSQTDFAFWDRLSAAVAPWSGQPASSEQETSGVSSRYELAAAIPKKPPHEQTPTAIEEEPVVELSAQSPPREPVKQVSPAASTAKAQETMPEQGERLSAVESVSQWQAIWNPFRSERSADGFANRLARLTQREYRVQRMGPGAYQVMFAFEDDADRLKALSVLQQHTGIPFELSKP